MKVREVHGDWVLRFELGDNFMEYTTNWARDNGVNSAFFHGLGGAKEISLGFYSLQNKKYFFHDIGRPVEVVSFHGNIARKDDGLKIHAHAVVSDSDLKTYGGHVEKLTVGPTLEVYVKKLDTDLHRSYDELTGLDQLDL